MEGKYVPILKLSAASREILDGEHDDGLESYFSMWKY